MKSFTKVNAKDGKIAALQAKNKYTNNELRRMKKERDKWKRLYKEKDAELKKAKADLAAVGKLQEVAANSSEKVAGHNYSKFTTNIATKIRSSTSCGARDVATILEILNEETGGLLGDDVPCANTIDNWTTKCGLYEYNNAVGRLAGKPYAMVIDDSMIMGGQRLLLALVVPAEHTGDPLTHGDVILGGIYVEKSFDSEYVKKALVETAAKVGYQPEYVISDNASIMKRGTRLAGMRHHSDITHTLGMFLERAYKKEQDFCAFNKQVSDVFFKNNMLPIAYLLPPKQRSISRFINMDRWVQWAYLMLERMSLIPKNDRETFSFIPKNASLVEELCEVISCVRYIETVCKHEGLSKETGGRCMAHVDTTLMRGNDRMRDLGLAIKHFLKSETEWVGETSHNNSSDIIESTYGIYKGWKSPNKMYGVTSLVLRLPLCGKTASKSFDVERGLTNTKIRDIQEWKKKNLLPNLVSKRLKVLKMAV